MLNNLQMKFDELFGKSLKIIITNYHKITLNIIFIFINYLYYDDCDNVNILGLNISQLIIRSNIYILILSSIKLLLHVVNLCICHLGMECKEGGSDKSHILIYKNCVSVVAIILFLSRIIEIVIKCTYFAILSTKLYESSIVCFGVNSRIVTMLGLINWIYLIIE